MTKPMTNGIFTAGALALAIAGSSPAFGLGLRGHGACDHGVLPGGGRMLHALSPSSYWTHDPVFRLTTLGAWRARCSSAHDPHALDLRTDQKQKVRDILTAHQATLAPLVANERAAKQAIADQLQGTGTVTPQDLDALVQQESQARTALLRERLAAALDVRSVLTPDQIQKAATIHAGVKDLRAQMRHLFGNQGAD